MSGNLDEAHGVSPSPGATALAALALLALGREFEKTLLPGVEWLRVNGQGGWGIFPGSKPDDEITRIARMVLYGSQKGWRTKIKLFAEARKFSRSILSLGQTVVPGLEGPTPNEILLPAILEDKVLVKLPAYGRPVVVAASLITSDSQKGIRQGIRYLLKSQMPDGSWAEDITATSLAVLALIRKGGLSEHTEKAGQWLVQKQYRSGGWPAFDQLKTWAMGWAVCVFAETAQNLTDNPWLTQAIAWLKQGQNLDGSYGSTPPFTHPDLDDTAVALIGLQGAGTENPPGLTLLKQLQNSDGSWGTFPAFKGIPPDISSEFPVYIQSVDVSIHVLEALWLSSRSQEEPIWRGFNWVLSQQDDRGAFPASWFEGPIYSTAQALELFGKSKLSWERWPNAGRISEANKKSLEFILQAQNNEGGWGSVVETSLALSGLMRYAGVVPRVVLEKGIKNLLGAQRGNGSFEPSYQGIYAKGWNYEEPITTALTAIRALQRYRNSRSLMNK
jgi:prenyltransferase beta subunit